MDFDYKKYSLENLENWMQDALSVENATPQEIYDVIKKVVNENYHIHKLHASRCYELLALLNGNGKGHVKKYDDSIDRILSCDKNDPSEECKKSWTSFWEENYYPEEYKGSTVSSVMPPWGHSDMEALRYTEEELNAMCENAASDQEKAKCREYNLREAEYYDKRSKLDMNYQEAVASGWEMTGDGFWIPPQKKDKVKKWVLPVEIDAASGEYYINFPDDLLETANLEEGDQVRWIDNGDGSYTLTKVTKPLTMDNC